MCLPAADFGKQSARRRMRSANIFVRFLNSSADRTMVVISGCQTVRAETGEYNRSLNPQSAIRNPQSDQ
jgi:hypothetical protein